MIQFLSFASEDAILLLLSENLVEVDIFDQRKLLSPLDLHFPRFFAFKHVLLFLLGRNARIRPIASILLQGVAVALRHWLRIARRLLPVIYSRPSLLRSWLIARDFGGLIWHSLAGVRLIFDVLSIQQRLEDSFRVGHRVHVLVALRLPQPADLLEEVAGAVSPALNLCLL